MLHVGRGVEGPADGDADVQAHLEKEYERTGMHFLHFIGTDYAMYPRPIARAPVMPAQLSCSYAVPSLLKALAWGASKARVGEKM